MAALNVDDDEVFQDYGSRGRKPAKMDVMVRFSSSLLFFHIM